MEPLSASSYISALRQGVEAQKSLGICTLGFIPMRATASECAEMVSQLIFGDAYEVLAEEERWLQIRTLYDNYEGWIDRKLHVPFSTDWLSTYLSEPLTDAEYRVVTIAKPYVCAHDVQTGHSLFLTAGAHVALGSDGRTLFCPNRHFVLSEPIDTPCPPLESVRSIAPLFLGTPYLWGGRTFFGIDCSGFSQQVYSTMGLILPRDASKQALLGTEVAFGSQRDGDLAFFVNANGRVCHVAICLGSNMVIHASGCVREDGLTADGIYNKERNQITHKLCSIRRIVL